MIKKKLIEPKQNGLTMKQMMAYLKNLKVIIRFIGGDERMPSEVP